MYDLVSSIVAIFGGVYCYLMAIGKVEVKESQRAPDSWFNRNKGLLKVVSIFLIVVGVGKFFYALNAFLD